MAVYNPDEKVEKASTITIAEYVKGIKAMHRPYSAKEMVEYIIKTLDIRSNSGTFPDYYLGRIGSWGISVTEKDKDLFDSLKTVTRKESSDLGFEVEDDFGDGILRIVLKEEFRTYIDQYSKSGRVKL